MLLPTPLLQSSSKAAFKFTQDFWKKTTPNSSDSWNFLDFRNSGGLENDGLIFTAGGLGEPNREVSFREKNHTTPPNHHQ